MPPGKRSGTSAKTTSKPADPRSALLEFAKLTGDGRKRGRAVPDLRTGVADLAESPGGGLTLLDLLRRRLVGSGRMPA